MAHLEANSFLNQFITSLEPFYGQSRILEIGSYDVNGSVRSNFKDTKEYVGVDLIPGPSVDVVSKGHLYCNESKFDIVLSVESFEHNSFWIETLINMIDLADDDGVVIVTCATTGRFEHGTFRTDPLSSPGTSSSDNSYYKNLTIGDFLSIPGFSDKFIAHGFYINRLTRDLYFYGLKGGKKVDVDTIATFFKRASERSAQIRKETNYLSYLTIQIVYLFLSPLYFFLSDENYQKITYLPYKKIRNLISRLKR